MRSLKGLDDVIQLILTDFDLTAQGWLFTGKNGSADRDPLYGFVGMKQLYLKASPDYVGRYTVPVLWDKQTQTIVNNESSEIIRMLYFEFDDLIASELREDSKQGGQAGFYPDHVRREIDDMNDWVYHKINNGVYKCGFATTQEAYDQNIYPLFESLDRVEAHLADPQACRGGPFLFGNYITEADIRLYTTMARFDAAYHTIFMCNLKMIRHDYPRIHRWMKRLYWNTSNIPNGQVFKDTTVFEVYRYGYIRARQRQVMKDTSDALPVMPRGPVVGIDLWTEEDDEIDRGRRVAFQQSQNTQKLATTGMNSTASTNGGRSKQKIDLSPENREVTASGTSVESGPGLVSPTVQHSEENAKWYKAAKKAEKKSGAPYVHLAL